MAYTTVPGKRLAFGQVPIADSFIIRRDGSLEGKNGREESRNYVHGSKAWRVHVRVQVKEGTQLKL